MTREEMLKSIDYIRYENGECNELFTKMIVYIDSLESQIKAKVEQIQKMKCCYICLNSSINNVCLFNGIVADECKANNYSKWELRE